MLRLGLRVFRSGFARSIGGKRAQPAIEPQEISESESQAISNIFDSNKEEFPSDSRETLLRQKELISVQTALYESQKTQKRLQAQRSFEANSSQRAAWKLLHSQNRAMGVLRVFARAKSEMPLHFAFTAFRRFAMLYGRESREVGRISRQLAAASFARPPAALDLHGRAAQELTVFVDSNFFEFVPVQRVALLVAAKTFGHSFKDFARPKLHSFADEATLTQLGPQHLVQLLIVSNACNAKLPELFALIYARLKQLAENPEFFQPTKSDPQDSELLSTDPTDENLLDPLQSENRSPFLTKSFLCQLFFLIRELKVTTSLSDTVAQLLLRNKSEIQLTPLDLYHISKGYKVSNGNLHPQVTSLIAEQLSLFTLEDLIAENETTLSNLLLEMVKVLSHQEHKDVLEKLILAAVRKPSAQHRLLANIFSAIVSTRMVLDKSDKKKFYSKLLASAEVATPVDCITVLFAVHRAAKSLGDYSSLVGFDLRKIAATFGSRLRIVDKRIPQSSRPFLAMIEFSRDEFKDIRNHPYVPEKKI